MTSNQEPEQRATYDRVQATQVALQSEALVTYWGDGYVKVLYPQELRYMEDDQEALRRMVRFYESLEDTSP